MDPRTVATINHKFKCDVQMTDDGVRLTGTPMPAARLWGVAQGKGAVWSSRGSRPKHTPLVVPICHGCIKVHRVTVHHAFIPGACCGCAARAMTVAARNKVPKLSTGTGSFCCLGCLWSSRCLASHAENTHRCPPESGFGVGQQTSRKTRPALTWMSTCSTEVSVSSHQHNLSLARSVTG